MLLLVALLLSARAEQPAPGESSLGLTEADRAWAVATSRMLGAAGTVRDRAWNLGRTADEVVDDGRIGHMSALASDVRQLNQAVASATLAAEVVTEAAAAARARAAAE